MDLSRLAEAVSTNPNRGAQIRRTIAMLRTVAPRKAIEALVFVANDAKVAVGFGEFEEDLFLDVVGVLVFVHHDESYVLGDAGADVRNLEQIIQEFLKVGEVHPVLFSRGFGGYVG